MRNYFETLLLLPSLLLQVTTLCNGGAAEYVEGQCMGFNFGY